jgi:hypothetical protein
MSKSKILELVCVYQSSQGFISRTGALLGKQIFLKPCALAALTTVNMQPRAEWVAFVKHVPVPVRCVYADTKASDLFYVIRGHTPCVVARCDHNQSILLLDGADLQVCRGNVHMFQESLHTAIQAKFVTF